MATQEPTVRTTTPTASFLRGARGGISGGAIFTGVVVAFGAMSLLSALVAGIVVAIGIPEPPFPGVEVEGGLLAGTVVVVAQFVSYLWGGYTAGRMARGAGVANGLLVPLVGLLLVALIGAVVAALGTDANVATPFQSYRLEVADEAVVQWGAGIGIAILLAMFVGGGLGGALGMRWHTHLEREVAATSAGSETTDPDRPAVTNLP